ncbi:hypothetical protein CRE_29730 [Caenorhabditis remanei]|uniref:Uncharacterized protein n=1 Tax=Caenorhabditis remanei TaxID=31234 RepID=E3LVF8_CAERE|nr:hypothetical protein CRE_29730 [Caenorhabditis remanei]
MSFFSFATSVVSNMSAMITNAAETVANYVTAETETPIKEVQEKDQEQKKEKKTSDAAVVVEETAIEKKSSEEKIENFDDDFEVISDHDLYVVLYEYDRGIATEENFFIDLEESTRYH